MRVHVIYAHPLDDSLAARLHQVTVDSLTEAGHEVDDLDLYADGFNPVMSAKDREDYHDVTRNRAEIGPYVDRLLAADALVLCHPVWNFGWPAMMKGYFDRVFVPDVSFKLNDGKIGPGLTNIRKLATVTSYGSKRWRAAFLGDPPRRNATRFLRVICNAKVKVQYNAIYSIDTATPEQIEAYVARVRARMLAF